MENAEYLDIKVSNFGTPEKQEAFIQSTTAPDITPKSYFSVDSILLGYNINLDYIQ